MDAIPDDVITAGADPNDLDADGISGRVAVTDGGRIGRFGWKAQVPSLAEFVRDAVTAELGMTLQPQDGLTFGAIHDNDTIPDPEMTLEQARALLDYMMLLAPPARRTPDDADAAEQGEALFDTVGCTGCHTPELDSPNGAVPLYSDLLLHEILPEGAVGIEDGSANMREFRTAPLWGISTTAPLFPHRRGRHDRPGDPSARRRGRSCSTRLRGTLTSGARCPAGVLGDSVTGCMKALVLLAVGASVACGDSVQEVIDAGDVVVDDGILSDELSMPLEPTVALENFRSSEVCGVCHTQHYAEWRTSMHSYALIDPVYRAIVSIRQQDFDGKQDKFCLQCHSAIGTRGGDITANFSFDDLSGITLEGVTCEACHKVAEVVRPYNSGHRLDDDGPIRGPIKEPATSPLHESEYSPLFEKSEFCAGCHDVVEVSGMNLERPYEEWLESPAGGTDETCQSCHMPEYEGNATAGSPTRTLHRHTWVGVDVPLTDGFLSEAEREELLTAIEDLLTGTATLTVQAADSAAPGQQLDVFVSIKNNIRAHNLPTGSTFNRQVWLEMTVTDADDGVVYQTGDLDDNGDLRNHYSELDPYGDQDLISLSSRFVTADGTPEIFPWRASEHINSALSPLYERTHTLFVPVPAVVNGPLQIDARLRFRSFPPYLLRALGLGDKVDQIPIFDIDVASLQVEIAE